MVFHTSILIAKTDTSLNIFKPSDVLSDPRNMWVKVRQLTGRSKSADGANLNPAITADVLNKHYAAISTDANYTAPSVRQTSTSA